MRWDQVETAMGDAVASGSIVGATAGVWSELGHYIGAAGESVAGHPLRIDAMFDLASMTKAVTSVAMMQLIERGALRLDDPAGDYVPYLRDVEVLDGFGDDGSPILRAPTRPVTVRHLATHTAGFGYEFSSDMSARFVSSAPDPLPGSQARYEYPLMFDPGDHWLYGVSTDWLGRVVEVVSGQRLDAYLRDHVLGPLQMEDTTFFPTPGQVERMAIPHVRTEAGLRPDPVRIPAPDVEMVSGGGGLFGTVGDYLRFVRMLLGRGSVDGVQVLAPDTVDQMCADQFGPPDAGARHGFGPAVRSDLETFTEEDVGWGLSFSIHRSGRPKRRSAGSLSWMGALNTFYWIDPSNRIVGVYATQVEPFLDLPVLKAFSRFERAVYDTLG